MDGALGDHLGHQRLVDRLFTEVLNGGNLDVLPQIYSAQVVDRNPLPGGPSGIDGVRHSISAMRNAFPDCHYTVLRVVSEGDTVTVRAIFSGTQTGRLLLRPGNGRRVESTLNIAFRIADGRIVERRVVTDSPDTTPSAARAHRERFRSTEPPEVRGVSQQDRTKNPKALIVGGGIGGLATAVGLRKAGWEISVFERAPRVSGLGAGLHLWSNAILALDELGLGDAVRGVAAAQRSVEFSNARGDVLATWPIGDFVHKLGAPVVAISRAELTEILLSAIPDADVIVGAECVGFEQSPAGVTARFADGRVERGDVLIGADGLNSAVRRQLLGDEAPRYTGYAGWRAVVDLTHEMIGPGSFRICLGHGHWFVYYSVAAGRVHWMSVAKNAQNGKDGPDVKQELLSRHQGWPEPIASLIAATPARNIIRSESHDRKPVARWGKGRVTLLGDAAHPMTFTLGQGAGMAIEDAVVLARMLMNRPDHESSLYDYETARKPRTASMVNAAAVIGRMNSWSNPIACALRDSIMRIGWEPFAFKKVAKDAAYGLTLRGALLPVGRANAAR